MLHVVALPRYHTSLILGHVLLKFVELGHLDGLSIAQVTEVGLLRLHHLANGQVEHVFDCESILVHIEVAVESV